jgi:hypothetical protein
MPPAAKSGSAATTVLKVIGSIAAAFVLLLVVLVAAVTLLGKSSTSAGGTTPETPPPADAAWIPWHSADGAFTVDFPTEPQVQDHHDSGSLPWTLAVSAFGPNGEAGYMTLEWKNAPQDPKAFSAMVSAGIGGLGLKSTTLQDGTCSGRPCYNFFTAGTLKDGTPIAARGMAMHDGSNVIMLIALGTPEHPATDWDKFLNTLQVA